ncbi:MAG: hypothetical protein CR217_10535 [Beijerinckiaceae bacterium]|nr:MAG: hypothetical protein CR217_10535 [Beijerinckiaceae bacterium]
MRYDLANPVSTGDAFLECFKVCFAVVPRIDSCPAFSSRLFFVNLERMPIAFGRMVEPSPKGAAALALSPCRTNRLDRRRTVPKDQLTAEDIGGPWRPR